jgi:heterodisulfide reductase subunit A
MKKEKRIGVYVCHCGFNIAATVNPEAVAEYASTLRGVVVARHYMFTCSQPGQDSIKSDIKEHRLDGVVVAACSPLMHERTFRRACREAGLNPYLFEMANIREQCSWVHREGATEKARELVRAAVMKVCRHEALVAKEVLINPNALILGAGIAGIQAALDIANAGYKVYLVEREPSIGGHMIQLDKTFPTLDCSACILTPKMSDVGSHPNIELLNYSEVEGVSGYIGNFRVKIKKKAKYVDATKCTGCGLCFPTCPVIMKNEFDQNLAERRAVYIPFPQAVPNKAVIDKREDRPCKAACVDACPIHSNVPGYVKLIAQGRFQEAYRLIRETNPFPSVCGSVCYAPCEDTCNRGQMDEPLAIRQLKMLAADQANIDNIEIPQITGTGKTVAVIGAGPAGLTSSYYLALNGHKVDIFDQEKEAGGMMRWAIPEYRLPKSVLERDLKYLWRIGVNFSGDRRVTLKELLGSYDAILIATGNPQSRKLNIEGAELAGVLWGLDFLKAIRRGDRVGVGERVVVIGGGNVAIDVAASAKRLGAKEVLIACLEEWQEMPAHTWEIEQVLEEGIKIHTSWGPKKINGSSGSVSRVELKRCTSVFDEDKRFNPKYDESVTTYLDADTVIFAIGQAPEISFLKGEEVRTERDLIAVDSNCMTTLQGVFACGEAVRAPGSVIDAIAAGKKAAHSINAFLRNEAVTFVEETKPQRLSTDEIKALRTLYSSQKQLEVRREPAAERTKDFRQVIVPYAPEEAVAEARRCLAGQIDGCIECGECARHCEAKAIDFNMRDEVVEVDAGSVILATGYQEFDPSVIPQYGYRKHDNVITGLEFERLSNASGPTGGEIRLKNGRQPQSVAVIHCVGSRDKNFHEYCSRVCCTLGLKIAHLVRDKTKAEVYQMFIDMRCFGEGHEEFYKRISVEDGINFVRGKVSRVTDRALNEVEQGKLIVCVEDTLSETLLRVPVDMVVLCAALEPRADAERVARLFSIGRRADGFFLERHVKLDPISTMTDGIFVAGCGEGPKDIPDTVAQAKAAASEALSLFARGRVEIEPIVSAVDEEVCAGCGLCETMCDYGALSLDEPGGVMTVNQAVCKGCGACASICPSGAISLCHFTYRQMMDQLEAFAW